MRFFTEMNKGMNFFKKVFLKMKIIDTQCYKKIAQTDKVIYQFMLKYCNAVG